MTKWHGGLQPARRLLGCVLAGLFTASSGWAETVADSASPHTAPDEPSGPYRGIVGPVGTPEPVPSVPAQWDRALPLFAQRVVDKGYNLPNPYHVGYSYYSGNQRYQLTGLSVSAGANPLRPADFVQFQASQLHTSANQVQVGAWLFPFMNVYGLLGTVEGGGPIDVSFSSRTDLANFFGVPVGCGGHRPRPDCAKPIRLPTQHASYNGVTYGGGFTLVGTYRQLFFSLPVTYTHADISMSDTPARSLNISPRVGWNFRLGHGLGLLTPFVGATYFRTRATISGHFDIPMADAGGQTRRLNYEIHQQAAGEWSGSAGANWAINRNLGVLLEIGFGHNRNNVIATAFLRF